MRKNTILLLLIIFSVNKLKAQEKIEYQNLNLSDAIKIALEKNTEIILATTKASTKNFEIQSVKNYQYPDIKMSGQYLKLTNANVNLKAKTNSNNSGSTNTPKVNELMLGQININLPVFSGFKLKNSIKASENLYQAELAKSEQTKEEVALKVVEGYANLYKAQKAVELIKENLKSATQRVKDFSSLEQNGIIARNDLLKAQLQLSKVKLTLEEANKNVTITNFYLITLLKLPDNFKIIINEHQFDNINISNLFRNEELNFKNRKDLEALNFAQKANDNYIKIAKSNYFPSIGLTGGFIALNLQNVVTISNAMNVGLGISYNLSTIFKNKNEVKIAKNKALETQQTLELLSENIKVQLQQSVENFNLAIKQKPMFEEAITQATENYRIVKDKYDNGLSNTNDLLEADVELLNTKINYAYSKANIMLKYFEMLAVSGELISSFNFNKN